MFGHAWLAGGIPRTACVAAYEPICAGSLADSYINRANPGTYDASPGGVAPTWAPETGWTFNGTSQYLLTGYAPVAGGSLVVRFSDGPTSAATGKTLVGAYSVSGGIKRQYLSSYHPAVCVEYGMNGQANQPDAYPRVSPYLVTGVLALAGTFGYRNGVQEASVSADYGSSGSTVSLYIAALNADGGPYGFWPGNIQAVYIYNVPITPTQVRAVTDAMNMLPMRPRVPAFPSWMRGAALTQFRKLLGLRTGSRGVSE